RRNATLPESVEAPMARNEVNSTDSPTAWFCELERAIRSGHRDREVEARRELARLGVLVTIDARSVLAGLGRSSSRSGQAEVSRAARRQPLGSVPPRT